MDNFVRAGRDLGHEIRQVGMWAGGDQLTDKVEFMFDNWEKGPKSRKPKADAFRQWVDENGPFDYAILNSAHHVNDKHQEVPAWLTVLRERNVPFVLVFHNKWKDVLRMSPHIGSTLPKSLLLAGVWTFDEREAESLVQLGYERDLITVARLPYHMAYPLSIYNTDKPRGMVFTSRVMKGKGVDMAAMLAKEFDIGLEIYGWWPQHRGGTTEGEVSSTPWWNPDFYRGTHQFGLAQWNYVEPTDDERSGPTGDRVPWQSPNAFSPYERGRVHLNLNRWSDNRRQPEYVTLEAIDAGCIPLARIEHWNGGFPPYKVEVSDIRRLSMKPEEHRDGWAVVAEKIKYYIGVTPEVHKVHTLANRDWLRKNHNPQEIVKNLIGVPLEFPA
jgi:hypothetical protein